MADLLLSLFFLNFFFCLKFWIFRFIPWTYLQFHWLLCYGLLNSEYACNVEILWTYVCEYFLLLRFLYYADKCECKNAEWLYEKECCHWRWYFLHAICMCMCVCRYVLIWKRFEIVFYFTITRTPLCCSKNHNFLHCLRPSAFKMEFMLKFRPLKYLAKCVEFAFMRTAAYSTRT